MQWIYWRKTKLSMLRLLPSFGEFSSGKLHCLQPPALRRDSSEHCTKSLWAEFLFTIVGFTCKRERMRSLSHWTCEILIIDLKCPRKTHKQKKKAMSKFHTCSTQIGRIIYWTICQQMKVRWNMPTRRVSTSVTVVAHDFHWKSFKFVRREEGKKYWNYFLSNSFIFYVISDHDGWRNNDAWVFKTNCMGI